MNEDATIALRTRSKLSLSSIPIDHIESSFVPPDELPMPVVDDIWSEFLQECMNPEASKNEDDEDDPEYNVAADPDASKCHPFAYMSSVYYATVKAMLMKAM